MSTSIALAFLSMGDRDKLNDDSNFLIRRLQEGEEIAYEILFKEYYQMLTVYANKFLKDIELAKEIVQDLFVNLYEKRNKLDINTSLKSYLFRSVHNRCINQLSSAKRRDKYIEHVKITTDESENILEKEVDASELEFALYNAIGELPPRCKEIFRMNRFEGKSNTEIAERLSLSKRTVETQISKALKILRTKLKPYMAIFFMVVGLMEYVKLLT